MNERILALAKQAGLKKDHGADREYIGDFDWRQFADLIIIDVVSTIYRSDIGNHKQERLAEELACKFGIK